MARSPHACKIAIPNKSLVIVLNVQKEININEALRSFNIPVRLSIILLAHRDYVPGELVLSPSRWRQRLSASMSAFASVSVSALAQCLSFQRCA